MKLRKQSGVIAYRYSNGQLEVLLVTKISKKGWSIPKGGIEPNLSSRESARKEAYEEAGISRILIEKPLGFFQYIKQKQLQKVQVFSGHILKLDKNWPEKGLRRRRWFAANTVMRYLPKELAPLISKFLDSQNKVDL